MCCTSLESKPREVNPSTCSRVALEVQCKVSFQCTAVQSSASQRHCCGSVEWRCLCGSCCAQHPAPSTQHPAPSTQHPAPSTQHPRRFTRARKASTKPSQQATATILPSFRPAIAFTPYIPKKQTPPTRRVREVRMGEKGEGGRGRKEMMGECAEWIGEEEQGTREEKGEEGERRREQQRMERQPLFLAPRA
jgi:hypothetical protein